jgi:hypothetical protein
MGRVLESPAALGDATAEVSEFAEPLELDPAAPPPPPPSFPPELSTRTVPCMFGWIVQM